jgi:perosamine synthetase
MLEAHIKIIDFIRSLYPGIDPVPLHAPVFLGNEKKYLAECIDSTYVSSVGQFVERFEEMVAEYTSAKKAVACVNGTSALHLALKLVGVEEDTEVITQPLTFVATANAIMYCNAHPIFLDVDLDTLGLSPRALRRWLENSTEQNTNDKSGEVQCRNRISGRRISAVVPMHTFGFPCKIDGISEICSEYNIPLVEDAAESLGSFYKGKHTGLFGEIGVLSFNGNKTITTGGGGMLLFNDETLATKAKHLSTQAKVSHPWAFVHDEVGYNYRMPNINAALGCAQMEQIENIISNKRQTAVKYKRMMKSLDHLQFFEELSECKANYWLNVIVAQDKYCRDILLKELNNNGLMARPAWELMNDLTMFADFETDELLTAKDLSNRLVNLPSGVRL